MHLLDHPPSEPILYTCQFEDRFGSMHACAKAHRALVGAGVNHQSHVFGKGRPLALGTTGKRPDLKRISGQEKLPVLALPDETTLSASRRTASGRAKHSAAGGRR